MKTIHFSSLDVLLKSHYEFQSHSELKGLFGDGYLSAHSKIYSNLRQQALQSGVKYCSDEEPWAKDLLNFPLSALNIIYKRRTIPYRANLKGLEFLKENISIVDAPIKAIEGSILHETCHVIANDYFGSTIPDYTVLVTDDEKNELTIKLLAVESFANTVEFLFMHEKIDETLTLYAIYNSFLQPGFDIYCILEYLKQKIELYDIFRFINYCYIYSNYNFNRTSGTPQELDFLIRFLNIKTTGHGRELLFRLLNCTYNLNRGFTSTTTQRYIFSIGGPNNLEVAYAFDINKVLFEEKRLESFLKHLFEVVYKGSGLSDSVGAPKNG